MQVSVATALRTMIRLWYPWISYGSTEASGFSTADGEKKKTQNMTCCSRWMLRCQIFYVFVNSYLFHPPDVRWTQYWKRHALGIPIEKKYSYLYRLGERWWWPRCKIFPPKDCDKEPRCCLGELWRFMRANLPNRLFSGTWSSVWPHVRPITPRSMSLLKNIDQQKHSTSDSLPWRPCECPWNLARSETASAGRMY